MPRRRNSGKMRTIPKRQDQDKSKEGRVGPVTYIFRPIRLFVFTLPGRHSEGGRGRGQRKKAKRRKRTDLGERGKERRGNQPRSTTLLVN